MLFISLSELQEGQYRACFVRVRQRLGSNLESVFLFLFVTSTTHERVAAAAAAYLFA